MRNEVNTMKLSELYDPRLLRVNPDFEKRLHEYFEKLMPDISEAEGRTIKKAETEDEL